MLTHACRRLKYTAKYGNSDTTTKEDREDTKGFTQFPLELADISTNESALLAKAGYTYASIDKSKKVSTKKLLISVPAEHEPPLFSTPEDEKCLNGAIQGTYESVEAKSSMHDSKTVKPSPLKEVNSYSAVNDTYESVDKGVKKPPLPVLKQTAPLPLQENDCQLTEGAYDSIGLKLTELTVLTKSHNHQYACVNKAAKAFGNHDQELPHCKPHTSLVQPPVEQQASSTSTVDETSYTYASVDMSQKTSSKKVSLPTLPSDLKTSKEPVLLLNVTSYSEITQD